MIYIVMGLLGGLVRSVEYALFNKHKKIIISKLFRNAFLGMLFGLIFGYLTNNVFVAFIAGTAGEVYGHIILKMWRE